jgi:L-aspartate oxidase
VRDVLIDTLGIEFDTAVTDDAEQPTDFDFGREAAHSTDRILHVDASTGTHILRPFLNYLDDHEDVTILEDTAALELIQDDGVAGALLDDEPDGAPIYAGATVLATGGIGSLYRRTTNPPGSTGDGIAMAAMAGAKTSDMAFVQFHPTAYDDDDPFLLSEALRGEGALLRNANGERFMPDVHPDAELAPRDVVARAVDAQRRETGEVRLDVSPLEFAEEFPDLAGKCEDRDVDWREGIPVAPCEHFLCGGITVDDRGRTSLEGLFAVGECARTGVHGANRLASTSLLEGLVWGLRAGEAAAGNDPRRVEVSHLRNSDPALPDRFAEEKFQRLRRVMEQQVGLRRSMDGLERATGVLRRLKGEVDAYVRTRTSRSLYELRNASIVSLLIAEAAMDVPESVGTHYLEAAAGEEATAPNAEE